MLLLLLLFVVAWTWGMMEVETEQRKHSTDRLHRGHREAEISSKLHGWKQRLFESAKRKRRGDRFVKYCGIQ